ncbi:hypothetical protein ANN_08525 [Periplaneta americana]|uniref:Uncharacterized protein n=1 Tax=Periplaneta americana TaxID=6978 RepID=A0ABQ8T1N2_PERAM|nr:hypothetical protein ANN_08525 [Periplaneta americana]
MSPGSSTESYPAFAHTYRVEGKPRKKPQPGLALRKARWFESSCGKKFSHEISASVWDRCPPCIVMHLGSYDSPYGMGSMLSNPNERSIPKKMYSEVIELQKNSKREVNPMILCLRFTRKGSTPRNPIQPYRSPLKFYMEPLELKPQSSDWTHYELAIQICVTYVFIDNAGSNNRYRTTEELRAAVKDAFTYVNTDYLRKTYARTWRGIQLCYGNDAFMHIVIVVLLLLLLPLPLLLLIITIIIIIINIITTTSKTQSIQNGTFPSSFSESSTFRGSPS